MGGFVRPQRPAVGTGRVHQREVGGGASLSVTLVYDQQRRTFRVAVCEERVRTAAGAGAARQARGVILPNGQLREKQGRVCERSGMEESASEPECSGDEQSRPIFMQAKTENISQADKNSVNKTDVNCGTLQLSVSRKIR